MVYVYVVIKRVRLDCSLDTQVWKHAYESLLKLVWHARLLRT